MAFFMSFNHLSFSFSELEMMRFVFFLLKSIIKNYLAASNNDRFPEKIVIELGIFNRSSLSSTLNRNTIEINRICQSLTVIVLSGNSPCNLNSNFAHNRVEHRRTKSIEQKILGFFLLLLLFRFLLRKTFAVDSLCEIVFVNNLRVEITEKEIWVSSMEKSSVDCTRSYWFERLSMPIKSRCNSISFCRFNWNKSEFIGKKIKSKFDRYQSS